MRKSDLIHCQLARLFLALSITAIAACAGGPQARSRIDPIEPRVDAIAGRTLVMPVEVSGPIDPRSPVDARLDDGRRLRAGLFWISVGAEARPDPRAWLAPAGRWFATPAAAPSRPSAAGVWAVVLDVPADAGGQSIRLGERRIALNWLTDPAMNGDGPSLRSDPPATAGIPWLAQLLAPERQSPARRWRWRLAARALNFGDSAGPAPFDDPVLEALAVQNEARWAAALARVRRDDAALAAELTQRLVEMVRFADVAAPAWPAPGRGLDNLLGDMLSPTLDPSRRAERARAWLAAQPAAVAWIADDAGPPDVPGGVPIATVGVANLSNSGALAGPAPAAGSLPADLTPLEPRTAAMLSIPFPADPRPGSTIPLRVRVGGWEGEVALAPRSPARPPGLRLGPLLADWNMEEWMAGRHAPPAAEEAAALLLMREDAPQDASIASGWIFYIEARRDAAAEGDDVIRIWLGPAGRPTAILRVSSDGMVVSEGPRGVPSRAPTRTDIARLPDGRWACRVPVPPGCVEADGTLRIGVERVDSRGRRTAWPRPMLPWQTEPGRLAVDTTAWGGFGADEPAR